MRQARLLVRQAPKLKLVMERHGEGPFTEMMAYSFEKLAWPPGEVHYMTQKDEDNMEIGIADE